MSFLLLILTLFIKCVEMCMLGATCLSGVYIVMFNDLAMTLVVIMRFLQSILIRVVGSISASYTENHLVMQGSVKYIYQSYFCHHVLLLFLFNIF